MEYVKIGTSYVRTDINKPKAKTKLLPLDDGEVISALESFEVPYQNDPQYVLEYSREIFEFLRRTEHINKAKIGFLGTIQTQITDKMRAILIDWLLEVHQRFELLPETLFFAINLIDRFLSKVNVNLKQFQLLGVTSMHIASKYEEIYAPEIRDFIYVTERSCTRADILEMEGKILSELEFDLLYISPFRFLERFHFVGNDNTDKKTFFMAQYLIELSLLEYNMLSYSSSLIAASALFLSRKIFKVDEGSSWNNTLQLHTGYKEKDLVTCSKDLCKILDLIPHITLKACFKKFCSPAYKEVASYFHKKLSNEVINQK